MARTTTWTCASRGGTRSPLSSPCIITRAPIIRVVLPQEVCQAYSWLPSLDRYWMLNALAKFCPNSWLVPIWRALPSPIIPSRVRVLMAPANRSLTVLRPGTTSIARTFSMKSP